MIDLHLHILPGVDDGAATTQDALDMAAALLEMGVHTVAATPHFASWTHSLLPDRAAIARRVDALALLLAEAGLGLRVVPGGETYLSPELLECVTAGIAPTLGAGPYLLMELPATHTIVHATRAIARMHRLGVTILLAHAERYPAVQRDPAVLRPFLDLGGAVQVSLGSLGTGVPRGQRRAAESLLTRGLAAVLATDAHRTAQVRAAAALGTRAAMLCGAHNLLLLTEENPRRILAGESVLPCLPPVASSPRRRWWPFGT